MDPGESSSPKSGTSEREEADKMAAVNDDRTEVDKIITHEEARIMSKQLLNYFENQDNITPSDLVALHRLRDLAALLKRRKKE